MKKSWTAEQQQILSTIKRRIHGGNQPGLKILVWQMTVGGAKTLKRSMDILLSLLAIVGLCPLFVFVALAIKLESRGRIIFRQTRVGLNGRPFSFYKFRSMYEDAEKRKAQLLAQNQSADGVIFKMKRDPRITRIGRFIRKTSIDELPQLFNVLIGDMSMVGPRPPLPSEVALYTLDDRKRLHVRPGITGPWQVAGRSDIPFRQQVRLDKEYISNHGFWKDFIILLKTIPAVLTGRGAY